MSYNSSSESLGFLDNIPMHNEDLECYKQKKTNNIFSFINNLHLQLDDIILIGLIYLLATEDGCDNFLLIILVYILISGFNS